MHFGYGSDAPFYAASSLQSRLVARVVAWNIPMPASSDSNIISALITPTDPDPPRSIYAIFSCPRRAC